MGRRKSYEREHLIAAATPLFHVHGYAGTSTEMLVEALGVNRNSMYAEFGSKQALFEACLVRHDREAVTQVFGRLEATDAGLDTIDALFADFATSAAGAAGLGCMFCNTAAELGDAGEGSQALVASYFERVFSAFRNALEGGRREGVLVADVDVDIDDEARHLTATSLGIFVLVRARLPPGIVASIARAAKRQVASLRRRSR